MGCPMTRRALLKHSAMVAATFPAGMVLGQGWSLAAQAQVGIAVPMHLELVTVTDTSAIITWFTGDPTQPDEFGRPAPVAADGRVLIGTSPNPLDWVEVGVHAATPYHAVEITDLVAGTQYFFRAESGGIPAVPTTFSPIQPDVSNAGTFTTLTPPPGELVAKIVWMNDLHVGEGISGIAFNGLPPGYPADPAAPYWRFMARTSLAEATARGGSLLIANGDVTASARPEHLDECKQLLDAFGQLGGGRDAGNGAKLLRPGDAPAYVVNRGNHDRAHRGADFEGRGYPEVPGQPGLIDSFRGTFADGFIDESTNWATVMQGARAQWRFIGLDSNDLESGAGRLGVEQMEFLDAQLAEGDPAFVCFHHPAGDQNVATSVPPITFGVDLAEAQAFRQKIAQNGDHVIGIYQAHTHRNNRTTAFETGSVPFYEGAATKEYPGGYTIVSLYEGGYMTNFHPTLDPESRAWSERSRGEYLGLYPYYTLGAFADRNWVHTFDATAFGTPTTTTEPTPAPAPEPSATTDPPVAAGPLPATGAGAALAAGAAVAAGRMLVRRDDR